MGRSGSVHFAHSRLSLSKQLHFLPVILESIRVAILTERGDDGVDGRVASVELLCNLADLLFVNYMLINDVDPALVGAETLPERHIAFDLMRNLRNFLIVDSNFLAVFGNSLTFWRNRHRISNGW